MAAALAMTERRARRILGVLPHTDAATLKRVWREALKAARPDQGGGDPQRFREIIEAYRFLAPSVEARADVPAPVECDRDVREVLRLTPSEAAAGGLRRVRLSSGRVVDVRLPRGLGPNQVVRLGGQGLRRGGAAGDAFLHVEVAQKRRASARDLLRRFAAACAA